MMAWGMFRDGLLRGFEPGTSYTQRVYSPEMRLDGAIEAGVTIGKWTTFKHNGADRRAQEVTVVMRSPYGDLTMTNYLDEDRLTIRAVTPTGFGSIELIDADEAAALSDFVPPEFFMNTVISVPPIDKDKAGTIRSALPAATARWISRRCPARACRRSNRPARADPPRAPAWMPPPLRPPATAWS